VTVSPARNSTHVRRRNAGKITPRSRREIARGVVVEVPERTAGGWQVRSFSPWDRLLYGSIGRHRAEGRAKRNGRRGKHRERS
jgi:hypothetical protein